MSEEVERARRRLALVESGKPIWNDALAESLRYLLNLTVELEQLVEDQRDRLWAAAGQHAELRKENRGLAQRVEQLTDESAYYQRENERLHLDLKVVYHELERWKDKYATLESEKE